MHEKPDRGIEKTITNEKYSRGEGSEYLPNYLCKEFRLGKGLTGISTLIEEG